MKYTVGLLFSHDLEYVFLLRKERPEWQKGLLNGIGGKLEENETAQECINREALEEIGYIGDWKHAATLEISEHTPNTYVYFYSSVLEEGQEDPISLIDEKIEKHKISSLSDTTELVPFVKSAIDITINLFAHNW